MAQENSNSTMEMGTSDQVLVASKRKKTLTYTIGGIAMVVVVAIVVTLVVVLSGNEGGESQPIVSTTLVPTTPITTTTLSPSPSPPAPTTTEAPAPPTEDVVLDLESVINGVFSPATFNGTWTRDNDVLFRTANGDLVLYEVDSGSTVMLISNASQLLQQSSRVTLLSPDGDQVLLAHSVVPVFRYSFVARYTVVDVVSGNQTDILPPGVNATDAFLENVVWGPAGTSLAFVFNNNIYYQSSLDSEPVEVTTSGERDVIYNGIPDWVYEEEVFVSNNALWFSPDGARLAFATFNDTEVRRMKVPHYGVPGSIDYQYTSHHEIRYPKPGTTNPTVTVTLRDLETGAQLVYAAPSDELDEPILKTVQFVNNNTIALMWTNRVQTQLTVQLCSFNAACNRIYSYNEVNGWIDNNPMIFNQQGNAFITILPQVVSGTLYKQIVQITDVNADQWTNAGRSNTPHTVQEILRWTADNVIWYKATHVDDTSQQHIYSLDGADLQCFTCNITRADGARCLYNDATISQDASRIAINCGGPSIPQTLIYSTDGTLQETWDSNAEITALLAHQRTPETIRMRLPNADVQLQVPHDYLNRTNVPLLVYVYGGPDTALVTQQWTIDWGTSLVQRWGVAVAQIDGRGSGLRGVDNMFALNRRLGTYEIEDQIAVTRYLQDSHPWLDSNRTCIWGWSYGGYAASLALARGGPVFRCAAAVAPVVDWRFYDTIYTERYMSTPQENEEGYRQSSLLTSQVVEAYRDKRYMLIHGTADDNVHYQHAMLISRLLQRNDVYFTQMSYTDEDHGLVGVRPHLYHALEKFLHENML